MPPFKRQHYLPAAYLKYFSIDQQNCSRDSFVWRFDGKNLRDVPVVTQCAEDYFYSKERAAETEKMFQINENAYCNSIDNIRSGRNLEGRNRGDLLLAMFDFHLRNAVHKNRIGKEGVDAYGRRVDIFISQVLLDTTEQKITKSDVIEHIQCHWRLEIISAPIGHQFLTSDHPSVWGTLKPAFKGRKKELHFITLPITPKHMAIGFDRRVLTVLNEQATAKDVGGLNIGQMQNAERSVYMSQLLPSDQMMIAKRHLLGKAASPCEVNEEGWQLVFQYLPPKHRFSFMRLRPPLL